ncbi:hypothetical protein ScPMuIL_014092 [Solemya velum]
MGNVGALVSGAIFGVFIALMCLLSAVKAVKDRRVIKRRIAERERKKASEFSYDNNGLDARGETHSHREHCSIEDCPPVDDRPTDRQIRTNTINSDGVGGTCADTNSNARRFVHFSDISVTLTNAQNNDVPLHGRLSPKCLAVKKQIRRNSYELAIDVNPLEGENMLSNSSRTQTTAYENKAFYNDYPSH